MISEIKIRKSITLGTLDKHHPKTLYIEGLLKVVPTEDFNAEVLYKNLKNYFKKILPESITDFHVPESAQPGLQTKFSFEIFFKIKTKLHFPEYSKRIIPLISSKEGDFLSVLGNSGLLVQEKKKEAI